MINNKHYNFFSINAHIQLLTFAFEDLTCLISLSLNGASHYFAWDFKKTTKYSPSY